MNRESSIQLVYQLTMLIHKFLNFPAIELAYLDQRQGYPTARWSIVLVLQLISALSSAYSTLSLPIEAAQMRSLKTSGKSCSFWRNFCMLSKRMFQLLIHICITYITIFMVMKSDRFEYFRNFLIGKIGEKNLEGYGFVIYGSLIFMVFPLLVILENFFAVTILVAGQSRKKVQEIFSRFRRTLRTRDRITTQIFDLKNKIRLNPGNSLRLTCGDSIL